MTLKPGRIPCINPKCRRTAPQEKYEPGTEFICGKCFKLVNPDLKSRYHSLKKRWKQVKRLAAKRGTPDHEPRRLWWQIDVNWSKIKAEFTDPEKPEGLSAFLDEVGM
ncbi:MAG: hypothetical protein AAF468_20060 [Pseudomonadota bacterium]